MHLASFWSGIRNMAVCVTLWVIVLCVIAVMGGYGKGRTELVSQKEGGKGAVKQGAVRADGPAGRLPLHVYADQKPTRAFASAPQRQTVGAIVDDGVPTEHHAHGKYRRRYVACSSRVRTGTPAAC
mmetsp:Transcript_31209/g.67303  ORF Transcript_31209/g.67303 Transcript_31209/m.67303 type:complete len:126 (+) Transcript_31209:92-469(+)